MRLLLFFTVQASLAAQSVVGYEPYVYGAGLLDRAAPPQREALERVWQP